MPGGGKSLRHVFRNTLPPNREEDEWGRRTDDVKRRAVVSRKWVDRVTPREESRMADAEEAY